MRSNSYYLGICAGILVAMGAFLITKLVSKKTGREKVQYDERQKAVLGECYKVAFFALMGFLAFFSLVDVLGFSMFSMAQANFASILMAVGVFAILAIKRDAYFGIDVEKQRRSLFLVGVFMVIGQVPSAVTSILDGEFYRDGKFGTGLISLMVSLLWITIAVYAYFHKTKDEDEE